MKLNTIIFIPCIISLVIILSFPTHATEVQYQKTNISDRRHFVIGVEEQQYYPLYYYDKDKREYTGLASRILNEFAKKSNYTFEYKPYPIKRLHRVLVSGGIDFKFPANPHWANDLKIDAKISYSDAVIDYTDGVFVKPENIGKGNDSIHVLGTVLGFTPWDWIDKIKSGHVALKETRDFEAMINQLISERIDGAYVNYTVVKYHLKKSEKEGTIVFDKGLAHTKSQYLLSTAKHPEIIKEFNDWMIVNKELIDKLKQEYAVQ